MSSERKGAGWTGPVRYWATAAALVVWLLVLIVWRDAPPRSRPASAPRTAFSADRAWPVLSYLADSIGFRVAGTPGADSAAAYLERTLRAIPGVEVVEQDATGAWTPPGRAVTRAYSARNVLARIPGRDSLALLLSAHYDSPPESVGAADDGVAVASLVEVVRALAAGPRLAHTVIVNLNGVEEPGLLGAHAFTQHPWARDVRAFINLESAGPHGKAILFQAGPGNAWLVDAYARAAPYPYGSAVAQDIFQSGVIPSDTDFRIYRDIAGLRGLDIAMYEGGWAYHTQRDRTWNVSHGTMQQMGADALAVARAIAQGPLPGDVSTVPSVYYDVLGLVMLHYDARTARWLALGAGVLGLLALALAASGGRARVRDIALALAAAIVAVVAALAAAAALGAAAAYVAGRPMSWFAHPAAAILAFALAALAPMLVIARGLGPRRRQYVARVTQRGMALQAGVLLFWMLVLGALTAAGIGSAYLALWWVVGGAVGLAITALSSDERWWVGALIGAIPGAVLTLSLLLVLTRLFVPVFGRLPLPIAPDLVLALMVGALAALAGLALLPGALRAGAMGWTAVACAVAAVAAMGVSLSLARYTALHPQRIALVQEMTPAGDTLFAIGNDYVGLRRALARAPAMRPAAGSGPRSRVWAEPAADSTPYSAPTVARLGERAVADGVRAVTIRTAARGAFTLRVRVPANRIAGWSVPAPLPPAAGDALLHLDLVAPPDTGWRITLDVRGPAPLPIHLEALHLGTTPTPTAAALLRALPPWTDSHLVVATVTDTIVP